MIEIRIISDLLVVGVDLYIFWGQKKKSRKQSVFFLLFFWPENVQKSPTGTSEAFIIPAAHATCTRLGFVLKPGTYPGHNLVRSSAPGGALFFCAAHVSMFLVACEKCENYLVFTIYAHAIRCITERYVKQHLQILIEAFGHTKAKKQSSLMCSCLRTNKYWKKQKMK